MIKFLVQRSKAYSYLTEDSGKENKAKETKRCVMKRKLRFEHYKRYLYTASLQNEINYLQENGKDATTLKTTSKIYK